MMPLVSKSAGLSSVRISPIFDNCEGFDFGDAASDIRFKLFGTIELVKDNYEYNEHQSMQLSIITGERSAISVMRLDATVEFAITKEERLVVDYLTYATAPNTFVLASSNTCNSVSSGHLLNDGKYWRGNCAWVLNVNS